MSSDHVIVEVDAGFHDRENSIVYAPMVCEGEHEGHVVHEIDEAGDLGEAVPSQCVALCECDEEECECGCSVAFIVPALAAGARKRYAICTDGCETPDFPQVTVDLDGDAKTAAFMIGGQMFTRYNFSHDFVRPNAYPVLGPRGIEVTEYAQTDHQHVLAQRQLRPPDGVHGGRAQVRGRRLGVAHVLGDGGREV
ncbi:MAG: hypothetical protein AB7Y46_06390, partial [Armatimonadota bacterium]